MAQKKFQDLNLADSCLFAAAMEAEEISRLTLQALLDRRVDSVKVHAEHTMLYSSDYPMHAPRACRMRQSVLYMRG